MQVGSEAAKAARRGVEANLAGPPVPPPPTHQPPRQRDWNRCSWWWALVQVPYWLSPSGHCQRRVWRCAKLETLMPEIPVSKNAFGCIVPAWWDNLSSASCHPELSTMWCRLPSPPHLSPPSQMLPFLWPFAHIFKAGKCQVPASPLLECSYSHQNPGLPDALSTLWAPRIMYCYPKWLSQHFLTWFAPPGPCIEYTAMLFVLSPWLHPAFFQGKSCVVFLECLGLMQGLSLVVLVSSNLSDPHSAAWRMKIMEFYTDVL